MNLYYLSRYPSQNGKHELHVVDCIHLPNIFNRIWLGEYKTPQEALQDALKIHPSTIICTKCLDTQNNKKSAPFYKKWFRSK